MKAEQRQAVLIALHWSTISGSSITKVISPGRVKRNSCFRYRRRMRLKSYIRQYVYKMYCFTYVVV